MSENYDAIVIGGGVMGCATLHYLAELGINKTLLLERDTLASGSTGRSTTILRMHYSNRVTSEMSWWSRAVMADFEEFTGAPSGYRENQWILVPGAGNREPATQNVALAQSIGIDAEIVEVADAEKLWPYMRFGDNDCVVWEAKSGFADSHLVTRGFANSARERGAVVRLGVTVTDVMESGGRAIGVRTDQGEVFADRVVLTAGPWNTEFLESQGAPLPLHTVRHQVIRLQHDDKFADNADSFHPTIAEATTGLSARPDTPGHSLIGYREDPVDRDTYNQGVDTEVAIEAISRVSEIIPAYENATWAGGWSGLFTVTPDWNPVIDHVPGVDNLVVGAGFSGHGFKMSPAIGLSLAELVTGCLKKPHSTFNPLRFSRFEEGDLLKSAYGGNVFA